MAVESFILLSFLCPTLSAFFLYTNKAVNNLRCHLDALPEVKKSNYIIKGIFECPLPQSIRCWLVIWQTWQMEKYWLDKIMKLSVLGHEWKWINWLHPGLHTKRNSGRSWTNSSTGFAFAICCYIQLAQSIGLLGYLLLIPSYINFVKQWKILQHDTIMIVWKLHMISVLQASYFESRG